MNEASSKMNKGIPKMRYDGGKDGDGCGDGGGSDDGAYMRIVAVVVGSVSDRRDEFFPFFETSIKNTLKLFQIIFKNFSKWQIFIKNNKKPTHPTS